MLRIGDFSRLAQVSVKALRLYDSLGLLAPARVDPETGYRYYRSEQLPRLNRILALKDIGFSLDQVGRLLEAELSPAQLREVLASRRAETERSIVEERARLARIEARLRQLDGSAEPIDVVLKRVDARRVASVRRLLPNHAAIGQLFAELRAYQQRHRVAAIDWATLWHDPEFRDAEVDGEATFGSPDPLPADDRVQLRTLPALETMATAVHRGGPETMADACAAVMRWVEASGYRIAGPERVLLLERGGPPGREPITEFQIPVAQVLPAGENQGSR